MKMNFAGTILCAVSAMTTFSAFAADGQITFTGAIKTDACNPNTSVTSQTVSMGTVSPKVFSAIGSTQAPTKFALKLTGCSADFGKVKVQFDGTTVSGSDNILALATGPEAATGVGIQLKDSDQNIVKWGKLAEKTYSILNNEATLEFSAYYISTADTVKAGKVDAVASFSFVYN